MMTTQEEGSEARPTQRCGIFGRVQMQRCACVRPFALTSGRTHFRIFGFRRVIRPAHFLIFLFIFASIFSVSVPYSYLFIHCASRMLSRSLQTVIAKRPATVAVRNYSGSKKAQSLVNGKKVKHVIIFSILLTAPVRSFS